MKNLKHLPSPARLTLALLMVSFIVAVTGCQEKNLPKLPPAAGEGAPAAAVIPTLAQLDKQGPSVSKQSGLRAGTGSLQALSYAALGPKETGVLTAITVGEGDRVKKGQVVFKIDPIQAELAVEQAKANIATLKIQQAQAQLDYGRTKQLRERGSVPEDVLDQTKSRLDAITSQIATATTLLSMAQRHLTNMTVTSPIDGVVSEKRMNLGETATLMPPSVVLVVQDIDVLELRARLPETALKTVKPGAQITVRFPATGETRPVTIKRLAPTVDVRTRTIEIVAEIPNQDNALKAGMLAEVAYADAEPTSEANVNRVAPAEKAAGGDRASR